jgi:hypothetical protein
VEELPETAWKRCHETAIERGVARLLIVIISITAHRATIEIETTGNDAEAREILTDMSANGDGLPTAMTVTPGIATVAWTERLKNILKTLDVEQRFPRKKYTFPFSEILILLAATRRTSTRTRSTRSELL